MKRNTILLYIYIYIYISLSILRRSSSQLSVQAHTHTQQLSVLHSVPLQVSHEAVQTLHSDLGAHTCVHGYVLH